MLTHEKFAPKHSLPPHLQPGHLTLPPDQDPYRGRAKPPQPTVCPDCRAVFHAGRWQWLEVPEKAHAEPCPACHRVRDGLPAGWVRLDGSFFRQHREELLNLVRHVAERARLEHPLQRLMDLVEEGEGVVAGTTDIHLARAIGEALRHAYQGELDFRYSESENRLRVHWQR